MHRISPPPVRFVLTTTVMAAAGMLSALIDSTLGWEYLARELLVRLAY
jgi:hypothetical protein